MLHEFVNIIPFLILIISIFIDLPQIKLILKKQDSTNVSNTKQVLSVLVSSLLLIYSISEGYLIVSIFYLISLIFSIILLYFIKKYKKI